jgi:hypothetical protein
MQQKGISAHMTVLQIDPISQNHHTRHKTTDDAQAQTCRLHRCRNACGTARTRPTPCRRRAAARDLTGARLLLGNDATTARGNIPCEAQRGLPNHDLPLRVLRDQLIGDVDRSASLGQRLAVYSDSALDACDGPGERGDGEDGQLGDWSRGGRDARGVGSEGVDHCDFAGAGGAGFDGLRALDSALEVVMVAFSLPDFLVLLLDDDCGGSRDLAWLR